MDGEMVHGRPNGGSTVAPSSAPAALAQPAIAPPMASWGCSQLVCSALKLLRADWKRLRGAVNRRCCDVPTKHPGVLEQADVSVESLAEDSSSLCTLKEEKTIASIKPYLWVIHVFAIFVGSCGRPVSNGMRGYWGSGSPAVRPWEQVAQFVDRNRCNGRCA
jgi:hypothetical protein